MAKIDVLKEEVATFRTKMFYSLGFIMMFMAGIGSLYIKFIESKHEILYSIGAIILLFLIKISVIMYFKNKSLYEEVLTKLEKE